MTKRNERKAVSMGGFNTCSCVKGKPCPIHPKKPVTEQNKGLLEEMVATLEAWQDAGTDYVVADSFIGAAKEVLAKLNKSDWMSPDECQECQAQTGCKIEEARAKEWQLSQEHIATLEGLHQAEIEALHRERKGEVWYWQGDGEDKLESLTCPVLIEARELKDLIEQAKREERERIAQYLIRKRHNLLEVKAIADGSYEQALSKRKPTIKPAQVLVNGEWVEASEELKATADSIEQALKGGSK